MVKRKLRSKRPFILLTKKSKVSFCNSIVKQVELALSSGGRKMSIHNELTLRANLLKCVGCYYEK